MADGTLFGLVRDISDRRKAARVRDVLRQNNYFNDPTAAIQAVNDAGYIDQAVSLRDDQTKRAAAQAAALVQQQEQQTKASERYRTALLGVTQGLKTVRNSGGDLGGALDQLSPVLQRGFGMSPDEIVTLKGQLTTNPGLLDSFEEMFADPSKAKFGVVTPGGAVFNQRTGEITGNNPAAPKTVKLRRGDGGEDLYVIDENGQFVPAGPSSPGGTGAGITGTYSGPRTVNPQARGVRNNNEGNIKDGPWARRQPGYAGSDGTFARFNTPEAGRAAQESLLTNHYVNGQRSVNDIVNKYLGGAANKENSTASQANYKAYVAGRIGLDPSAPVPASMIGQLAQAMREFENGGQVQGAAPAGPRASSPGKPAGAGARGWRELSKEEKAARGLPVDRAYQIGLSGASTGKVMPVGGQPSQATGKAGKPAGTTIQAHNMALTKLTEVIKATDRMLNHKSFGQATGSIQGRIPSIFQGTKDFDAELQSYKDNVVLNALQAMKAASPNGASGFGSLQLKEGERLENSTGPLDPASPETLIRTLRNNKRDAQISIGMLFSIPPDATRMLIANPTFSKAFDEKYGAGMARKVLGK